MHSTMEHGLDPKGWGPHAWYFLHATATVSNPSDFVEYVNAFAKVIPCKICKAHFAENRAKHDIRNYMRDNESLLLWTYMMHDEVNYAQGKKGKEKPSWLEIRSRYFKTDDSDKNATPGTSKDYDATICTEICGATVAKLTEKQNGQETKLKILSRSKQTSKNKK